MRSRRFHVKAELEHRPLIRGLKSAGEYTGLGERFMRRYREHGIPYVRIGRLLCFDPDALDEWIDRHSVGDEA
jgi:excisionase family DNA binding protein